MSIHARACIPIRRTREGTGRAFREVGPTKIAVFSVVNALGVIVDRQGRVVRGNLDTVTGDRRPPLGAGERRLARGEPLTIPTGNTTLSSVVTNERLSSRRPTQFARQVDASMARIIQPFHTLMDGDVLNAVTINAAESTVLPIACRLRPCADAPYPDRAASCAGATSRAARLSR
jgi:L-aminopeptidase/D-esterase-like protein